jgi:YD repeat-containing protein
VTHYTYDAVGNLLRTDLPNGTSQVRTYDALGRLTSLENRGPGGVLSSYQYTLDVLGNRTAVLEDTGRQVEYTCDALSRLTSETASDPVSGTKRSLTPTTR